MLPCPDQSALVVSPSDRRIRGPAASPTKEGISMGGKSRTSVTKRQKEQARQQRRQVKEMRREQRAAEKGERPQIEGEDPDIAGIVPGPQPHPFLEADELTPEEEE